MILEIRSNSFIPQTADIIYQQPLNCFEGGPVIVDKVTQVND